jgi:hypothetical protein
VTIPLTTPFTYDPHNGKDFLIEVVCNDPLTAAATDIEVSFGPCRTQSNNTSASALTSNAGTVTAALVQRRGADPDLRFVVGQRRRRPHPRPYRHPEQRGHP